MYVFDFGAPVGVRLATRQAEWIAGLVVQNGNAYDEGLSAGARQFVALRRDVEGDEEKGRELFTLPATRGQYVGRTTDPELIAPDGWLHLFDTGHFALEENLPEIAPLIATFLDRTWRPPAANQPRR